MNDNLGLFDRTPDDPADVDVDQLRQALQRNAGTARAGFDSGRPATGRRAARAQLQQARRRRRRKFTTIFAAACVMLAIIVVVVALIIRWQKESQVVPDFVGTGDSDVIVRIERGDVLADIASTLISQNVVAGSEAFTAAAAGNVGISELSPGFYKIRQHASAAAAVAALTDPASRVGTVKIIPGLTLADVSRSRAGSDTTSVVPGYISQITAAACVPLNGVSDCFTADQLWEVARNADPATLGVVGWAVDRVKKVADPSRRLEGLIAPGDYDIAPGSDPTKALQSVLKSSAAYWNSTGVQTGAKALGISPYDAVVIASLIEKEGIPSDMRNVSRVIYNRLKIDMKLQFDSTVNYGLDRAQLATTEAERLDPANLYSTYAHKGLPPNPIGSPGPDAVDAMLDPAQGKWIYFVKVDLDGNSCFSVTYAQHEKCIEQARAAGVFD
ncbi:endolytic transglycosylase MltG [Nakamurella silvestris]|nr:endolytic transglycosylase MltG [Nakamurella silvestris]